MTDFNINVVRIEVSGKSASEQKSLQGLEALTS